MDTLKITIFISPFESWVADLFMSGMGDLGFNTFVETDAGFEAYIPEQNFRKELFSDWVNSQVFENNLTWTEEIIPAQNWNEAWEKNYFQPLVIKDRVVIRAPFHTVYPECPIEIVIEPNMAFGTGNHETTTLMLEAMLDLDFRGKTVLDIGCGTGILAILASKLGADAITAIDIDPWSFDAVSENRIINHTLNVTPVLGDGDSIPVILYDFILANIQKNVVLSDIEKYSQALKSGGNILFSGFYSDDVPDIQVKASLCDLTSVSISSKNNWVVVILQKK
jgi:ribosomal protein L11 methyltransferase